MNEATHKRLRALWHTTTQLRQRALFAQLRAIAEGTGAWLTPSFMDETAEQREKRPRCAPNLLGAALSDLSYLYTQEPVRRTSDPDAWQALWGSPVDGLTARLREADPWIRLGGTCLAVVIPSTEPGRIAVHVFEADRFVALPDERDPQRVGAALIRWSDPEVPADGVVVREEEATWVYLDADVVAYVQGSRLDSEQRHGIGRCPAVTLKNTPSSRSLYGVPMGGSDLLANLTTINLFVEELVYTGMTQRGQPVLVDADKSKNQVISPTTIIEVSQVGGFTFVPNAGDIGQMSSALQMILDLVAIGIGLPKRTWNVRSILDAASSGAVYARQLELSDDRVRREPMGLSWEFGIHELAQVVGATMGLTLSPLESVRYLPPAQPIGTAESIAKVRAEAELGLADREKLAADINPTLPPDEVTERVELATEQRERDMQLAIQEAGHSELAQFEVNQ